MTESGTLREKGNQAFKSEKYEDALSWYTQALDTGPLKDQEKAIVYKNRAACFLKLNRNEDAVIDATKSLELGPNDPKALFRRCQAYESLGQVEDAYKDAILLIKVDPQNKAARPLFNRLNSIVQEKAKQQATTGNKVSQMFNIAFDQTVDKQKRLQALNNLIVLSRENVGSTQIVQEGGLNKLKPLLAEKDQDIQKAAVRVLGSLAKGSKVRCAAIMKEIGIPTLVHLMSADTEEMASSVALLIQNLITYFTGLNEHQDALKKYEEAKKKGERQPYPHIKLSEESSAFLDEVFKALVKMLVSSKVSAFGRDSAMELITKNVTSKDGLDWTKPFLDTQGVENLLTVAGVQKEFKTLQITPHSSMHASVALSKIYDDLINDKLRDKFKEKCHEYFRDLFSDGIFESKIEAVAALSTLLQGTYDVGGMLLGLEGVTELMFTLAETDNVQYQRVAVEAIVSSASKKDKCSGILKDAVPILKKLYQSSEDHIKVRALVGLCKLGSFMGTDASAQPMAEGSTEKLARICRKFLVNATKDSDLRKWATEGLAYLTLDANIKEELVDDTEAIKSIFDLAKLSDRNTTYASVTVLVNCTNSYDKQDIMPELLELAKFAKQHIPEEHAKDKPEFISGRIHKLAKAGVINALVALSDTDSKNSRELISRVFMSLSTEEKLRGLIIQQGGIKSLLNLMNNNTDNGVVLASHALAKISVTSDPHFAFPGQRVYEVVRPLVSLLHADRSGLQNFEALMALTNLASVSDSVRNRIVKEKGIPSIEHYMFEEHKMLRRAATECMCNMILSEEVQELFEGENDRVKVLVLFSGEDDPALVKAATGALAILSARPSLCRKIVKVKTWLDIFQVHTVSEQPEIQHRACHVVMNIVFADKELASLVVDSPMLEILMAVAKQTDPKEEMATKAAQAALEKAIEYELIKENQQGKAPDNFLEILREQLRQAREEEEKRIKEEEEEEERKRKLEEEEKKKAEEKMKNLEEVDEEEVEEIIVDKKEKKDTSVEGPKIRELTDEEVAKLEAENKSKGSNNDEEEEIDKEELEKGDVWNDEGGLPQ
ncbi:protein unc-45 homolog B-like [Physella acuta]|uniref:protein unc-45 homolog B-like n=1 Tax=Physella acuta TaxID=109671 RepID=UPI0027DBBA00|nr:protein unc-45 homolog B-like [Physella acuta]